MSNDSININKTNNYLSIQIINTKRPRYKQMKSRCPDIHINVAGVKPVNAIPTLHTFIIGSPTIQI